MRCPQSLSVSDHESGVNSIERGKAKRTTHEERIKKVVEGARNDVALETGVHNHHICIKPARRLGQASCSQKFHDHSVPFWRAVGGRRW